LSDDGRFRQYLLQEMEAPSDGKETRERKKTSLADEKR